MEVAVKHNVPGILAECGGSCACGTCRVQVESLWREKIPKPSDMEEAIMDVPENRSLEWRLSCQVTTNELLDGLVVNVPERQNT